MKLLFVSLNSPYNVEKKSTGGAEWSLRVLATKLAMKGHEVHYITSGKIFQKEKEIDKVHIHYFWSFNIPLLHRFYYRINDINQKILLYKLKRKVENINKKYSIQLMHYYSPYPSGYACIYGSLNGRVVTVQRIGGKFWERVNNNSEKIIMNEILNRTDYFISNSQYLKNIFTEYFRKNIRPDPKIIIQEIGQEPFYIDINQIELGRLACIASLKEYQKRQDILIRTILELKKRGRKYHLYLIGGGSNMEKLNDLTNDLNLNDLVHFKGALPMEDARIEMSKAQIILHATEWEGISKALLDAMILSKPIIASNVGGVDEHIIDGITGLLSKNDPKDFADKIEFINENIELSKTIGNNANKLALEKFNANLNVNIYEQIFQELIDNKQRIFR